jgi:dolichyl-phosphate beta-glucosyltransferase
MESLSVVIPIYNESDRFLDNFKICQDYYQKQKNWEFIFINDGSTDKTEEMVKKAIKNYPRMRLITYSKNQGKGYAVKQGVLKAKKQLVLMTDIDFSVALSSLALFYPFIEKGADLVIGTRKMKGARIIKRQARWREWLGKLFTNISNIWLGLNISDYTCGFKLFRKKAAKKLFSKAKINGWGFDAEILFLAHVYKYWIVEVPVVWKNDARTRVKIWRDVGLSLIDLLRIRFNFFLGRYS